MCKKTLQSTTFLYAFIFVLVLSFLTLTSCSSSNSSDQSSAFSEKDQEEMTAVVQDAIDKGEIPGIIVGVWSGDKEWILTKGVSNIETGSPMEQTMNVRIGSITKSFTATIILQLVDEGKLTLDDPISRYVENIPNGENITVRQVLNMGSGLFSFTDVEGFEYGISHDPLRVWTPEELIALGVGSPKNPVFAPGEGFYYSNTNYVILGKVIENITGNTVNNEIQSRITNPLKLSLTYLPDTATNMPAHSSNGYYYDVKAGGDYLDVTNQSTSWSWTSGGIISNMRDVKTYIKAIGDGTLISPEMQAARLTFNPHSVVKDKYGYGLGVSYVNGYIGHNGSIPGYNSSAYYNPKRDVTIIILANKWKIPNLNLGTDTIFINLGKVLTPDLDWSGLE
jgi:D-alanyl-D-alanine carboxypeptidase